VKIRISADIQKVKYRSVSSVEDKPASSLVSLGKAFNEMPLLI